MKIALLNGGTIALIAGVATALWFANPALGGVIAAAMVVNIFVAGVAGVAIPLFLDRLDQDPAVASSIFVTMTADRSEERRVGKECASTFRYRGSAYH